MSNPSYTYHFFSDESYRKEWIDYINQKYCLETERPEEEYDINSITRDHTIPGKYKNTFMFNGDKYTPLRNTPRLFPRITGFPSVHIELMRPFAKRGFF